MHNLTEADHEAIADLTVKKLVEVKREKWVEPETHYHQHLWVAKRIEAEKKREELVRKIIESSAIWAVPLVVGFFAIASWNYVKLMIKAGP